MSHRIYAPRPSGPATSGLERGRILLPDLATLRDREAGSLGTASGTVYSATTESRLFDGGATDDVYWDLSYESMDAPWSVAAWVYPDSLAVTIPIFSTLPSGGGGNSAEFEIRTTGALRINISASGVSGRRTTSALLISAGAWAHVVATYTGSKTGAGMRMFIGGTEASYGAAFDAEGTTVSGDRYRLGFNAAQSFDGRIQAPAVWSRVLLPAEIAALAQHPYLPA